MPPTCGTAVDRLEQEQRFVRGCAGKSATAPRTLDDRVVVARRVVPEEREREARPGRPTCRGNAAVAPPLGQDRRSIPRAKWSRGHSAPRVTTSATDARSALRPTIATRSARRPRPGTRHQSSTHEPRRVGGTITRPAGSATVRPTAAETRRNQESVAARRPCRRAEPTREGHTSMTSRRRTYCVCRRAPRAVQGRRTIRPRGSQQTHHSAVLILRRAQGGNRIGVAVQADGEDTFRKASPDDDLFYIESRLQSRKNLVATRIERELPSSE